MRESGPQTVADCPVAVAGPTCLAAGCASSLRLTARAQSRQKEHLRCVWSFPNLPPIKDRRLPAKLPKRGSAISKRIVRGRVPIVKRRTHRFTTGNAKVNRKVLAARGGAGGGGGQPPPRTAPTRTPPAPGPGQGAAGRAGPVG
jgi:hypothetical protein